jgi:uncharacterized membrane protein YjjP (DUF1212 family)
MTAAPPTAEPTQLLEFMLRLAQALLACGEQTATVELILRRVASAYGARRSRVVAFPTAVFISFHDQQQERVTFAEGPTQTLRLDQIGDVYQLADIAQRGVIGPSDGIQQLNVILRKPARFGALGIILGHAILTVGLAIVLMPTRGNVLAAALLGTLVGALKVFNRNRPVLAVPLPVVAAAMVSALVFLAIQRGSEIDPLHVLIPPLVTFLPGAMLTMGMVELAYGDMVSGSSRLVAGFVQLVLLVLGLAAGAVLIGYTPANLVDVAPANPATFLPAWTAWMGVFVFGIGVFLHFSAPRNSLPWMLVALLTAFAIQRFASRMFGYESSGFFGMLAVTPLSYLIQLRFHGPPAMVTFLPSFWLLVPGALSLLSVKYMLSGRAEGFDGMVHAVFVFASIALGTLMGASLYKLITEQIGAWQLQLGRVGRYFRRPPKRERP